MHDAKTTEIELKRLAVVVADVRRRAGGSTWELPGIYAQLAKLDHLPLHQVATAAIWAALRLDQRTPAVIAKEGPHWRELPGYKTPSGPPECPYHPQHTKPCPECAKHVAALPDPTTIHALAAQARAAAKEQP